MREKSILTIAHTLHKLAHTHTHKVRFALIGSVAVLKRKTSPCQVHKRTVCVFFCRNIRHRNVSDQPRGLVHLQRGAPHRIREDSRQILTNTMRFLLWKGEGASTEQKLNVHLVRSRFWKKKPNKPRIFQAGIISGHVTWGLNEDEDEATRNARRTTHHPA